MKKSVITIAFGMISILLVIAVAVSTGQDRKGPVITFDIPSGKEITYADGQSKQTLKEYARALDEKDGDVSDSIMIEDVYVMSDLTTAKVIYVAKDKSNNITRADKLVKYMATQEELDNLNKQNAKEETETSTATETVSETKSESTSVKATEATKASSASGAKPVLTLSQAEVTITQGETFSVAAHVKSITDDKDDSSTLYRRIIVSGSYDAKTAGDYSISVRCTDTDGNSSNTEKLMLHVKSKAETTTAAPTTAPDAE